MISFKLRECAIPFFQHTLFIPEQEILFALQGNECKYLQFEGCDHVVLRLVNIAFDCVDKNTFEEFTYCDEKGGVKTDIVQKLPRYDEVTIHVLDKETGSLYEEIKHRQYA